MATAPVTGSLTNAYTTAATGISATFAPAIAISVGVTGTPVSFNITLDTLSGSFVGTAIIQKSTNGGANWGAVVFPGQAAGNTTAFLGTSFGLSVTLTETQSGVLYRVIASAYTSGTLNYQFGQ